LPLIFMLMRRRDAMLMLTLTLIFHFRLAITLPPPDAITLLAAIFAWLPLAAISPFRCH